MKKMQLTIKQVQRFLTERYKSGITDIAALSGGEWSQAFGFNHANRKLVVRFGRHQEDYIADQHMAAYGSKQLPIPKVLEVGEAFDGYYAISERAFGVMLDDLDKSAMRRVIPSLFATLDAMRDADISNTTGYGYVDKAGNGKSASWYDFLLTIADNKIPGWEDGLANSPVGIKPFEQSQKILGELARDLPVVRTLNHTDLAAFNVLVNNDQITAVIDWANAVYGDFLYDLANFTFWGPLYKPLKGIDWEAEALDHYNTIGFEVPEFERRLRCCMISIGLGSMSYYGYKKDWTYLELVAKRTLALAKGNDV